MKIMEMIFSGSIGWSPNTIFLKLTNVSEEDFLLGKLNGVTEL